MLLLFRVLPSFGVYKTEKVARKGHDEQEPKPSLSALMTCPAVLSPYIFALSTPLSVVS